MMLSHAPAALLGFLLASGAVVALFPFRAAWQFYQWTTAAHVLAGLLVAPALMLTIWHARSAVGVGWRARATGCLLWLLVLLVAVAGVLELVQARRNVAHAYLAVAVAVALVFHAWQRPVIRRSLLCGVAGLLPFAACWHLVSWAFASSSPALDRKLLPEDTYVSAAQCGQCHDAIFAQWSRSAHGRAYVGRAFANHLTRPASAHAMTLTVENVKRERDFVDPCLRCHAPTRYFARDASALTAAAATTRDGVGCPFCHTVETVRETLPRGTFAERMPEYVVRPKRVRAYVMIDSEIPVLHWLGQKLLYLRPEVHREDLFRPVMQTAEFCMPCHGLGDMIAKAPESTYQDWRASDYNKPGVEHDVRCQDCHMGPRQRAPWVRGGPTRQRPDHRFLGGNLSMPRETGDHDLEAAQLQLLRGAIELKIVRAVAPAGEAAVDIDVELRNVGVGHSAPGRSQMDSRYFWLRVQVVDAAGMAIGEMADPDREGLRALGAGVLGIVPDESHFLPKGDTSLRAGETRQLRLRVPLTEAGAARVDVELRYAGMLADWRDTTAVTLGRVTADIRPQEWRRQ